MTFICQPRIVKNAEMTSKAKRTILIFYPEAKAVKCEIEIHNVSLQSDQAHSVLKYKNWTSVYDFDEDAITVMVISG